MFIVYALLDLDKPGMYETPYMTFLYQPYYIGKASSINRIFWHKNESIRNYRKNEKLTHKNNKILKYLKKHNDIDYCYFEVCSEDDAYRMEEELVDIFGISNNGGILTNSMGGGFGGKLGYWHYLDSNNKQYYLHKEDGIIETLNLKPISHEYVLTVIYIDSGEVTNIKRTDFDETKHKLFHEGKARPDNVRKAISEGKKNYKFTNEHLMNITAANKIIGKTIHLGAKRKSSTKEKISKSRTGSKSKVAKTWRFIDPFGVEYIFRGGFGEFCLMMGLSAQRMRNNIGSIVKKPVNAGHLNRGVINTTGWYCEETDRQINFEFFYTPKHLKRILGKL